MKKWIPILLCCALLTACAAPADSGTPATAPSEPPEEAISYESRFSSETRITLSDDTVTVDGNESAVSLSHDIVYYEDRDTYPSGNPYGAGDDADKHTDQEAAAHTVVNITQPGAYRVTGTLSAGQLRIDLGEGAYDDESAVVELILDNAAITCTVAPAILFRNVYECDGNWSTETATAQVDTSDAGARLILVGENTVRGSYVAKIYKDNDQQKKLWKQDGAIYSYMSMNVYGSGILNLYGENEGLDTELHLTINGGDIRIRTADDGINTNEDGVSVTTVNAGSLHIIAGLGSEGDGIDSNGFLVINGGTVVAAAHPASDAGLDSDMGSYIHGGVVVALGSTMDWAESDSSQVTMNLQFAQSQSGASSIVVTDSGGNVVFAYDPAQDEILGENTREYRGAILSCPDFRVGESYRLYLGSAVSGSETGGVYTAVTSFTGGTMMMYTGTDVGMGAMGPGGRPMDGEKPEGMEPPEGEFPEGMEPPEGEFPEGMEPPDGEFPGDRKPMDGQKPEEPDDENPEPGQSSIEDATLFYMTDAVNAFSGITPAP